MLKTLHVANLGVLGDVEADLPRGLVCLTGETGAGKSLLVDAIQLLLGARADAGDVRHGAREALIEAVFDVSAVPGIAAALADAGCEVEDGEVRLRRVVSADGRGKAYIQGRLATARELREVGGRIVSVAGQHAFIGLGQPAERLSMVDAFAGTAADVAACGERHDAWHAAAAALAGLRAREAERAQRQDYLEFVARQIEAVAPQPGEIERLAAEAQVLRSALRLKELAGQAADGLYEGADSAFERVGRVLQAVHEMARIDARATGISQRLDSVQIEAREAARDLADYADRLADDPARLAVVEERLDAVKALVRKHGGSVESALDTLAAARRELGELGGAAEAADRLEAEVADRRREFDALAGALTAKRTPAARGMAAAVTQALRGLAMEGATLDVTVDAGEPSATGVDRVDFRIETNPGEGWGPVTEVASGGELSRITLALYSVLSETAGTPVMVYDEVDAGLSGAVADRMGEVLARAARNRQVLIVTHHGQIAARASAHFAIGKRTEDGRTAAHLACLDADGRLAEVARMLGGQTVTERVTAHARELLEGSHPGATGSSAPGPSR